MPNFSIHKGKRYSWALTSTNSFFSRPYEFDAISVAAIPGLSMGRIGTVYNCAGAVAAFRSRYAFKPNRVGVMGILRIGLLKEFRASSSESI